MRCQYCGSKMIHPEVQHKHFSAGKAVAGAALIGVVGAAAGFIGKDKSGYSCGACGAWSERPMDFVTDFEINRTILDAKNGKNIAMYETFKTRYPNIENVVFSNDHQNPVPKTATDSLKLLKEDIESQKNVDEENVSTVKHRYKYNGYALGSPILINEIEIKEGEKGDRLSLNIKNISQSEIRSAYFNVEAFDDAGDKVSESSFAIQGTSVKSGEYFPKSKDYDLKSDMSYYVALKCQKVVFSDNTVWRFDENTQEVELQEQGIISDEEFPKYKYLVQLLEKKNKGYATKESVFAPVFENGFVQCFCGCPFERNSKCPQCGLSEDDIVDSLSAEKLFKKQISDVKKIAKERTKSAAKRRDSAFSELYKQALPLEKSEAVEDISKAIEYFSLLNDYNDSADHVATCKEKAEEIKEKAEIARKDAIYLSACQLKNKDIVRDLEQAIAKFNEILDWKDSQDLTYFCEKRISEIKAEQERQRIEKERQRELARAEMKRQEELARIEEEKRRKKHKIFAVIAAIIICLIIAFVIVLNTFIIPNGKYNDAIALMKDGKYEEAIAAFEKLDGFKDSIKQIENCKYDKAIALMNEGQYSQAILEFKALHGHRDSAAKIDECKAAIAEQTYNEAVALMENEKYDQAIATFKTITGYIGYKDVAAKISNCNAAITEQKYNDAIALMEAGEYDKAITHFKALNGYKDSADRINECLDGKYNDAISLIEAGNFVKAYEALVALDGYKDSHNIANSIYDKYKAQKLKIAKAGDCVLFGSYEQDNNTSNGKEDIEWIVLEVKDGKLLVISKYALDYMAYNTKFVSITWGSCTLSKWLNNDFISSAFTASEKNKIPVVLVSGDNNPSIQSQVFLLSISEATKYFNSDSARCCRPTNYAVAKGADKNDWWLRSPGGGSDRRYASCVSRSGDIFWTVVTANSAVRPVMWIDPNA